MINYDEKNFVDYPGKSLVVVQRGTKHPEVFKDTPKKSISVMFCVSADENILPLFILFKNLNTFILQGLKGVLNDPFIIQTIVDCPIFEDWFYRFFCRRVDI